MTQSHSPKFYEHFLGNNHERTLLLVDSWVGHRNPETTKLALPSKDGDVLLIPVRITEYFQPLKVFHFGRITFMSNRLKIMQ
jgi:hypothetical protein